MGNSIQKIKSAFNFNPAIEKKAGNKKRTGNTAKAQGGEAKKKKSKK